MTKKIFLLLLLPLALLVLSPSILAQTSSPSAIATSSAKNIVHQEVVKLNKNEAVNNDYFAWGERIEILGTINGDAYIAGGNIVIDGVINGDLLVAGGNIEIKGEVTGDVRAAGGDIGVSGGVGGNVTALGGSVELSDKGKIAGSLVAAGGEINVLSSLGRGITVATGELILGGPVGSGVTAGVGHLTLNSGTRINGDLTYWSDDELTRKQDAFVSGKITHNLPKGEELGTAAVSSFLAKASAAFTAISTLSYLLVGFLFLRFFPTFSDKTAETINAKPLQSLGIGLLATILTPLIFILLLVTIIGIPLAFIILFAYLSLIYLSTIFVALFIGQKLLSLVDKKTSSYLTFIVGLLVYQLLVVIPAVGIFISMAVFFIGMGAILITKKHFYDSLRSKDSA